jgi:hypothetical protein
MDYHRNHQIVVYPFATVEKTDKNVEESYFHRQTEDHLKYRFLIDGKSEGTVYNNYKDALHAAKEFIDTGNSLLDH